MDKKNFEMPGRCVIADNRFKHVMAIALNPQSNYKDGIVRCIVKRDGDVQKLGYIDRSKLFKIKTNDNRFDKFAITEELKIKGSNYLIKKIAGKSWDFLGFEDPDIWIGKKKKLMHVYFTIAFKHKFKEEMLIGLGHAEGQDLDSLRMAEPVLLDKKNSAKELSIAPVNSKKFRYNLIESSDIINGIYYSTIRLAIVENMSKNWKFGDILFHPKKNQIAWAGEHASPGPLFSKSFMDVGENKLLGVMNGRETSQRTGKNVNYGVFSIGLFIYDYEKGKIDWISPKPLIKDSEAKTITFASDFVEIEKGLGILYAHVDDSFVRAYRLTADFLASFLP
jgi:hypothetical protein